MLKVLVVSAAAGVMGTLLGGVISLFLRGSKEFASAASLFAGGFMIAIVSFELLPEAMREGSFFNVLFSFVGGVLLVIAINCIFTKKSKKGANGFLIFLAIAIHNFPEGLAIGGGEVASVGATIALLIAIHNIPEGLALSVPFSQSGKSVLYPLFMCALAGLPMCFGGGIGYLVSSNSEVFVCSCLSLAAGSMTYVTFSEILPDGTEKAGNGQTLISVSIGFFVGFIACAVL